MSPLGAKEIEQRRNISVRLKRPAKARSGLQELLARESRVGRAAAGVTQAALAEALDIQQSRVSAAENGRSAVSYSARDLCNAPAPVALRLVRLVAAKHGATVREWPEPLDGDSAARAAAVAESLSAVVCGVTAAAASTDPRADAIDAVLAQVREAMTTLGALERALFEDLQRRRG